MDEADRHPAVLVATGGTCPRRTPRPSPISAWWPKPTPPASWPPLIKAEAATRTSSPPGDGWYCVRTRLPVAAGQSAAARVAIDTLSNLRLLNQAAFVAQTRTVGRRSRRQLYVSFVCRMVRCSATQIRRRSASPQARVQNGLSVLLQRGDGPAALCAGGDAAAQRHHPAPTRELLRLELGITWRYDEATKHKKVHANFAALVNFQPTRHSSARDPQTQATNYYAGRTERKVLKGCVTTRRKRLSRLENRCIRD
jgi:hypothetical protein